MDGTEPLDVLFVGAHPDDVEVGCGGTVRRLANQGYRVGIVDLTNGEPTPLGTVETRMKEAAEAAGILGVAERVILELPNRKLFDSFEARVELAKVFRKYRPRLVLGLGAKTPLASPDHYQAVQITDGAVFYSRLSKWDEYFGDLPVYKIPSYAYYYLSFEANPSSAGNVVVQDISDELEIKMQAIAAYASQFPPDKQYLFERIRALAIAYGQSAGFQAGELFSSNRMIGSRDLVKTLCP